MLSSTSQPSSRTSIARTSSATSHTRPSGPSALTICSKKAGTCHGDRCPVRGGGVHRIASRTLPHDSTRRTICATASSFIQWATGVRECDVPCSYSAHQRTTTESPSRRTVPTRETSGRACASKLPSEDAIEKRRRSAGSHDPRNSATSAEGICTARSRGKPSRVASPSMRAIVRPPSSSRTPASRSMRGLVTTSSPLRATTLTSRPPSSARTSMSASHVV